MASSTIADDGAKNGLNSGGINHLGDDSIANSEPTMEGATAVNGGGLPEPRMIWMQIMKAFRKYFLVSKELRREH